MSDNQPRPSPLWTPADLRQLLSRQPAEAECRQALSTLDAYIQAQLAAEDYLGQFPETARHLDQCPDCAQAYGLLFEAHWAEQVQQLAQPETTPTPDLSFLEKERGGLDLATLAGSLRQQLKQMADRVQLQLTPALLPLLQPLPQTAVVRQASESRYGAILLSLTPDHEPDLELPFTLMAYQDDQVPENCLIEILVEPAGMSWPDLGGRQIDISWGDAQLQAETDDWGTAAFPDVPIAALSIIRVDIQI